MKIITRHWLYMVLAFRFLRSVGGWPQVGWMRSDGIAGIMGGHFEGQIMNANGELV